MDKFAGFAKTRAFLEGAGLLDAASITASTVILESSRNQEHIYSAKGAVTWEYDKANISRRYLRGGQVVVRWWGSHRGYAPYEKPDIYIRPDAEDEEAARFLWETLTREGQVAVREEAEALTRQIVEFARANYRPRQQGFPTEPLRWDIPAKGDVYLVKEGGINAPKVTLFGSPLQRDGLRGLASALGLPLPAGEGHN